MSLLPSSSHRKSREPPTSHNDSLVVVKVAAVGVGRGGRGGNGCWLSRGGGGGCWWSRGGETGAEIGGSKEVLLLR